MFMTLFIGTLACILVCCGVGQIISTIGRKAAGSSKK